MPADDPAAALEEIRGLLTRRDRIQARVIAASEDGGELQALDEAFTGAQDKLAARVPRLLAAIEAVLKLPEEWEAVSRIVLFGGHVHEVIHVDKAFLIAAIQDARSWCHEMEGPGGTSGPTSGNLADYDAALAVLEDSGHSTTTPPST